MKVAALALALPFVSAKLVWKQCPGNWEIDISNIVMTPAQPVGSKPIELVITGKYTGTAVIRRLFADVKGQAKLAFVSKSIDDESPVCPYIAEGHKCPIKKGLFKWVVREEIPYLPVNGSGTAKMILFDKETSKRVGCLEMSTTVKRSGSKLSSSAEEIEDESFIGEIHDDELRM